MPPSRSRFIPLLLAAIGVALIVGAAAMSFWLIRSNQAARFEVQPYLVDSTLSRSGQYTDIPRISLEGAKAAFDRGAAVFVDTRGDSDYAEAHIPGAISLPWIDLNARLSQLDPNTLIIPYCT